VKRNRWLSVLGRGSIGFLLLLGLAGAHAGPAAGSAMEGPRPGAVQPAVEYYCAIYACYTVTVNMVGDGSGTWQSTDSNFAPTNDIHCVEVNGVVAAGSKCSALIGNFGQPIVVYYTLTPATGSEVCIGQTCTETAHDRHFDLTGDTTSEGDFLLLTYPITVTKSGAGTGTVTSDPGGINCGPTLTCTSPFAFGYTVKLIATPDAGASFSGWTGACAGQGSTCTIASMTGPLTTNAVFAFGSPTAAPTKAPTHPPGATAGPLPTVAGPTLGPDLTPAPGDSSGLPSATTEPLATSLASPSPTGGPPVAAVGASVDLTPIVLAILGAGLLIAIAIAVGLVYRRRGTPPA
jgi:hypothetical protein